MKALGVKSRRWNESLLVGGYRFIAKQVKLSGVGPDREHGLTPSVGGDIVSKTSRQGKDKVRWELHSREDMEVCTRTTWVFRAPAGLALASSMYQKPDETAQT